MSRQEDPALKGGRKGGEAPLHRQKVSAAQIQVYLKGIDYPVDKKTLVQHAKSNGAPENVVSFLNRLPERRYIEQEFGKLK